MDKNRVEILTEVIKKNAEELNETPVYSFPTQEDCLEAIKIAMKQAWISGFNDSSFNHHHGFLCQSDEHFDDWFNELEEQK